MNAAIVGKMAERTIRTLYVTLKRSFAGTPETMVRTLKALGLRRRHQTVRKSNNARVRGALLKVRHMVLIETDELYEKRRRAERDAMRLRDPVIIPHAARR